ncbi:hypothetical protein G6F56_006608 [Rhizopus delemar]|nr:hypothetical protein G6F56_006608 [Rhizopus delemar]
MSRNTIDDRNNTASYSDLPPFHNPNFPEWPVNKIQNHSIIQSNPQLYQSPSTGYPVYNNTSTAAVSTPSYCSTFSEASHSSPTLFWAHPASTNETENNSLFTEVAPNEITPEPTKISASSSEVVFESSQSEISDLNSHRANKGDQYSPIYHPHTTAKTPSSACTALYNKAHARFKSVPTCGSTYDESSRQKHTQQFLSPPLPSTSLMRSAETSELLTGGTNNSCKSSFQFQAILHSPMASMKKENQKPMTYLNRGQTYLLELSSMNQGRGTFTSTISIAFHESSHRKVANGYWKFWLSQQLQPQEARAIDIDEKQSSNIYNIKYNSFDKISFDWHGRFSAKISVRFHCLSTDFSRIKGVKGIPMRAVVETTAKYSQLPENTSEYSGEFIKKNNEKTHKSPDSFYEYTERCYCQMKLFRDKGAERKNKDDAKQIHKQLQKATALTMGNPQQHPSWSILNQPYKPLTALSEIPSSPEDETLEAFEQETQIAELYSPAMTEKPRMSALPEHEPSKKRKHACIQDLTMPSPHFFEHPHMAKKFAHSVLDFYIYSKRSIPSVCPERISLDALTREDLKMKLATALSLHPGRVSEVLWRKKKAGVLAGIDEAELLMLVDDPFIAENIFEEETVIVDWEMKQDNSIRLILEFNGHPSK